MLSQKICHKFLYIFKKLFLMLDHLGYTSLYDTVLGSTPVNGISKGQCLFTELSSLDAGFDPITEINSYSNFTNASDFLGYNRADLKISWPFWLFDNVILKIGSGASFGYLSEENRFTFYNQRLPVSTAVTGYYSFSNQSTWWGGGLLFTGDINFDLGYGLGIYIDSSAAFMFGRSDSKTHYVSADYNDNTDKSNTYLYQPVVKVASGLSYNKWFGPVQLYSSAGWEFNYWWYGNLSTSSALSFTGLTARLGVAY